MVHFSNELSWYRLGSVIDGAFKVGRSYAVFRILQLYTHLQRPRQCGPQAVSGVTAWSVQLDGDERGTGGGAGLLAAPRGGQAVSGALPGHCMQLWQCERGRAKQTPSVSRTEGICVPSACS